MALFTIENVAVRGISACVPSEIEFNNDIQFIEQKELQFLIKNVGVEQRRKVTEGVTASDLCYLSAKRLLNDLKWDPQEINLIVYVSQSRDYLLPCTSIILQDKLGISKQALAFDIPLGCSGYTYGLSVVAGLMSSARFNKALLLCGEISALSVSDSDKKTFPLFGDAGSATALELCKEAAPLFFDSGSDGKGYDNIIIPGGGCREPLESEEKEFFQMRQGQRKGRSHIRMNGLKVFEFSISQIPESVLSLLKYCNITQQHIDYFVMHQANLLMNETIRKKLNFEPNQTLYSLKKYGNTSSASIPLTIVDNLHNNINKSGKTILLCGFGVGLSWSTALLYTKDILISELIEYA